jgi:hypothetical protein
MKVALAGGTPVALAPGSNVLHVAVDPTYVYWTDYAADTVSKVGLGGGTTTHLASGQSGANGLGADATSIYWTDDHGGNVMKLVK